MPLLPAGEDAGATALPPANEILVRVLNGALEKSPRGYRIDSKLRNY